MFKIYRRYTCFGGDIFQGKRIDVSVMQFAPQSVTLLLKILTLFHYNQIFKTNVQKYTIL